MGEMKCERVNRGTYIVAWGFFGFGSHTPILKLPRPYLSNFRRVQVVFMSIMTSLSRAARSIVKAATVGAVPPPGGPCCARSGAPCAAGGRLA